jgi:CheY-like chemotaxis protein
MNQRILVFESDAAFADDLKHNFERMGLAVDVASDGPMGLELAAAHRPDLILLTIELPGMNGFLVCKKIKKTADLEQVPLVIMSSEVDQETFEQHKKLRTRADDYIRKPIAFDDLLLRIRELVPTGSNGASVFETGHSEAEDAALDIEEAFSVGDDDVIVLGDDDAHSEENDDSIAHDDGGDMAADAISVEDSAEIAVAPEAPSERLSSIPPALSRSPSSVPPPIPNGFNNGRRSSAPPQRRSSNPPPLFATSHEQASMRPAPLPGESASSAAAHAIELDRFRRELVAADERVQAAERRAGSAEQRASNAEKALESA